MNLLILNGMDGLCMEHYDNFRDEHNALQKILADKDINQAELIRLCGKKGYNVSQASVSKVLSGKKKMSVEECKAFCQALEISADRLLFADTCEENANRGVFSLSERSLESAGGILGDYYLYYESTAREENGRLIDGQLHLYREHSYICADIEINITHCSKKVYRGYLLVSERWPVAYTIVRRPETGEISVLTLRYREFLSEPMKCRVALCLTTCAGEQKAPIAHQMILVRKSAIDAEKQEKFLQRITEYVHKLGNSQLEVEEDLNLFHIVQTIQEEKNE